MAPRTRWTAVDATLLPSLPASVDGALTAVRYVLGVGVRLYRCHGCSQDRREGGWHLCPACWRQLPAETRWALEQRDGKALQRYAALLAACYRKAPLAEIELD